MLCANLVEFHAHLVCKKHDTMVISRSTRVMFAGITFLACYFICSCGASNVDGTSPGSVQCVNMQQQVSSNLKPCHKYSIERGVSGGDSDLIYVDQI